MLTGDLVALSPLLMLGTGVVATLLAAATRRSSPAVAWVAGAGLTATCLAVPYAASVAPRAVTSLLVVDRLALFFMALVAASALAVTVLGHGYWRERPHRAAEFHVLVLLATLGAAALAASTHIVSLFLGLETLGVALYGLLAYARGEAQSIEAGLKYLVLAATSSAFLLLGAALIYAEAGTMELGRIALGLAQGGARQAWILPGLVLVLVGLGFKLALVPFHMWAADVYQGAPVPSTALVATVSKAGVAALAARLLLTVGAVGCKPFAVMLTIVAALSMLAGNLLALRQMNLKRMLAYSSIAHMGYLTVALLGAGWLVGEAVAFYMLAYSAATLAAFGVIAVCSGPDRELDEVTDYQGLFWRRPALAAVLALALFSLAGLPLTAGFFAKYYVVAAGASAGRWASVLVLAVGSAIGLFYYLRVVVAMFSSTECDVASRPSPATSRVCAGAAVTLACLAALLVWLGVAPAPLIGWLNPAAPDSAGSATAAVGPPHGAPLLKERTLQATAR
jgi:NADH-quinone oxidoreductase subunit N